MMTYLHVHSTPCTCFSNVAFVSRRRNSLRCKFDACRRDLWIPFGFQTPISISLFRFLEEVLAPSEGRERREEGLSFRNFIVSLLSLPSFLPYADCFRDRPSAPLTPRRLIQQFRVPVHWSKSTGISHQTKTCLVASLGY